MPCCSPALRHRILLNFEGQGEGVEPDAIVNEVRNSITPTHNSTPVLPFFPLLTLDG